MAFHWTCSAFGVAVFFSRDAVSISGQSTVFERVGNSGFPLHNRFCTTRRSTVFWHPARKPNSIAVALGSFGDPTLLLRRNRPMRRSGTCGCDSVCLA
ncbi:GFA family protein [Devosia sp. UYZn731]|uniref:GFA family protein n=1 Tax=Devosia sp. UYZn731 TaxID=3156345 RepID=UPI0033908C42